MSAREIAEPVRTVEVIQVVRVVAIRGSGIDSDPYRTVISYWTLDGELLAGVDPLPLERPKP